MKCLIYSPPDQTEWLREYFPGVNPYYLKILNKPLLEYYIDFCVLTGIKEIRVVNNETGSDLERYFESGQQWGITLSYGFAKPEDSLEQVLRKNKSYCSSDSLLVIFGLLFIKYNKQIQSYNLLENQNAAVKKTVNDRRLFYIPSSSDIFQLDFSKIKETEEQKPDISAINSIKQYFDLNMKILENERESYFLPGYNNEDGVYIGKNVIDNKTTKYQKPLVLGDNIQLQMNTEIGPRVILGENVIVDHSTRVSNSIIYEHSYIGSELDITNKIVFKKRLIDPESEEVMQIVDSFLVSDIRSNLFTTSLRKSRNALFAIFMILITTIPFLFLIFLCRLKGMQINRLVCFRNHESATISCVNYSQKGFFIFKKLFFRLSLDLYPLYFKVLNGKLMITGNHLIPKCKDSIRYLHQLPYYQPGIYSYPGSMLHNHNHENFINDELEYCHTKSFWLDVKIILHSWTARLFSDWPQISRYLGEISEVN